MYQNVRNIDPQHLPERAAVALVDELPESGHGGTFPRDNARSFSRPLIRSARSRPALLPYEDEIRSVEGPDAGRGGPEGAAPCTLISSTFSY